MKKDPGKLQSIPLSAVCTDGTQCRVETYDIAEMAAEIREEGRVRQPIAVFYDGNRYWVGDGHHRIGAARLAGLEKIHALVRKGGQREALLYAVGANAEHGHRRTNADKRNAVLTLLRDKEWAKWSDNKIAKQCGVSNMLVAEIKKSHLKVLKDTKVRRVERNGTVYEQDTSKIGKRTASDSAAAPWQQPELPGTARPQIAAVPPHSPQVDESEDLSFLEQKRPGIAKPVNAPGVSFGPSSSPSPHNSMDLADAASLTLGEHTQAVIEIIQFCRYFAEEIQRKVKAVDSRHAAYVREKIESDLIFVAQTVLDLMPPNGKEAAKTRAKFSLIQGGQQ